MPTRRQPTTELERRYHRGATEVLDRLRRAKAERGWIAAEDVDRLAAELGLPQANVNGAASFYSDLGFARRSGRVVRVCDGACCFATRGVHVQGLRDAVEGGGHAASVERVYCLGYCYASPAALDGQTPHAGTDLVEQFTGNAPSFVFVPRDGSVAAIVEDDGQGFAPERAQDGGIGLAGMRERVALLEGRLEIESAPGGGTTLIADVLLS